MPFRQTIDSALDDKIGREGLSKAALDAALQRSEGGLRWLRERHADGGLPLLRLPATTDDLDAVTAAAARLRADATDVVFLGTGGSSLGGQTLAQLAGHAVPGVGARPAAPRRPPPPRRLPGRACTRLALPRPIPARCSSPMRSRA